MVKEKFLSGGVYVNNSNGFHMKFCNGSNNKDIFDFVMALYRDKRLEKYFYTDQFRPEMAEETMRDQLNQSTNWLCLVNGKPGGYIGLQPFSSFLAILHGSASPEFFGKGYAQKALAYVLDFAFNDLNYKKIEAMIPGNNILMERFLKRAEFKKEAELSNRLTVNGVFLPLKIYGMKYDAYRLLTKQQ